MEAEEAGASWGEADTPLTPGVGGRLEATQGGGGAPV